MDYNYSNTLKKLMKNQPGVPVQITIIILMLLLAVAGVFSYQQDKELLSRSADAIQEFDASEETLEYRKFTPVYLSEPFAANYDETILFCFIADEEFNVNILSIKDEDIEKYQDLIDYTYEDTVTAVPAPVTLEGKPQLIDDDMIEFAIEGFKVFSGTDSIDESTFKSTLGTYYLDTTQKRTIDYGFIGLMLSGAIALAGIYIYILLKAKKINRRTEMTTDRYEGRLLQDIDKELNNPVTDSFKKKKLYFTKNYIICGAYGFDVIPYEEAEHVYGTDLGRNRNRITVVTKDGIKHDIAEIILNQKGKALYNQIINQIKALLPGIRYGFEDGSFSIADTNNSLEVDEVTDGTGSNIFLGIIGAFLGAALGGVVWIIIGKIGFIAGIAGLAMMSFSILGYRKFSGRLDRKGKIISLIIALLMVFFAEYTSYALEYCKVYYSGVYSVSNLIYSFKNVFNFLTMTESWSYFLKELAIGYALSIWSGYSIIKSAFSKRSD